MKHHSFVWCVMFHHLFTILGTKNAKFEPFPKKLRGTFSVSGISPFHGMKLQNFFSYFSAKQYFNISVCQKDLSPGRLDWKGRNLFSIEAASEIELLRHSEKRVLLQVQPGRRSAFFFTIFDQIGQKYTFFSKIEPCKDKSIHRWHK